MKSAPIFAEILFWSNQNRENLAYPFDRYCSPRWVYRAACSGWKEASILFSSSSIQRVLATASSTSTSDCPNDETMEWRAAMNSAVLGTSPPSRQQEVLAKGWRGVEFFDQQRVYVALTNIPRLHPVTITDKVAHEFHGALRIRDGTVCSR